VDDILSGDDTIQEALAVKTQTEALLLGGGFELSKWAASHKDLCPDDSNAQVFQTSKEWVPSALFGTPDKIRWR